MRRSGSCSRHGAWVVLLLLVVPCLSSTYAQQTPALVIEGGTLIDGNGGAPVRDALVVIQGNKITAVSRKGQATYPANARVINAAGKFVLPGLWDSQVAYSWYFGEAMLNHGITSSIDVGTESETAVPHRDAVLHGKDLGPRAFTGILRIGSVLNGATGLESPLHTIRVPTSAEDTRNIVRLVIGAGADYVIFYDGALPMDYYRAGVEEGRKLGKPVFIRAYGPGIFPKDAALLGAAQLPHSAGIGIAVTRDPSKFRQGRDDRNELDRFADMDDAKAAEVVKVLVDHHVALVPTFMINFPGYPKDWNQFAVEARDWFKDPNLLKYYPADAMESALASYVNIDQGPLRERRVKGFENVKRFHKMFVDAGGHLVVSGNLNDRWVPGLDLFQEMQVMAEVGMTPMQIIQGSTKWAAEVIQKQDSLGTVEAGKIADVIIVNADPLADVRNLWKTDTVVFDGKVVDRTYHANYKTTFAPPGDQSSPTVEGLPWVVSLKKARTAGGGQGQEAGGAKAVPDPARSPEPAIESIEPFMVAQGATPATVTLKGFNVVRKSTVHFKGKPVPTQVVSSTELRFTLDPEALRAAGRFELVVVNPAPVDQFFVKGMWGSGTSNEAHLIVNYKY